MPPGRDDTTEAAFDTVSGPGDGVRAQDPLLDATPRRDELREQIAAATVARLVEVMDMPWDRCPDHMLLRGRILADAVMEPVDAWVAAHTAEVAAKDAEIERITRLHAELFRDCQNYSAEIKRLRAKKAKS